MKQGPHIDSDGSQKWLKNNKLHHEDGPAIIHVNGTRKCWYYMGQYHRLDGPAIEWFDNDKWYYLMNEKLTYEDWLEKRKPYLIQQNLNQLL